MYEGASDEQVGRRGLLNGKAVFIVEDNLVVGQYIYDSMKQLGAQPILCTNGDDAWQQAQNVVFPVIILDWNLPGMNGGELCRRLKSIEQYQDSIILIITGNNESGRLQEALNSGADDYITKPLTGEMLRVRIEIMLLQRENKLKRIAAENELLNANLLLEGKVHDRTIQLEKSKALYKNMIDHIDVGVVLLDREYRVVQVNPKGYEFFDDGIDPIGKKCFSVFHNEKSVCENCFVVKCFADGKSHSGRLEYVVGGKGLVVSVMACPIFDSEGNVDNVIEIVEDITEDVRKENELKIQVEEAQRRLLEGNNESLCGLIGSSNIMNSTYDKIKALAKSRGTVLLQGETGTGKEVTAKALHELSDWSDRPFISVNCGSLPESILESELFGHTKGAFTGALGNKAGLFAAAEDGTILLDEIETASMHTQVSLLRVLDQREVYPIGGREPHKIKARIIVASNKDLEEMVSKNEFREDLYYRICGEVITLPPLRDRIEDLPLLANSFLSAVEGKKVKPALSPKTLNLLSKHSWPGNVREFKNLMSFLARAASRPLIRPTDLPEQYGDIKDRNIPTLYAHERELVERVLKMTNGNKSDAAKILSISRNTVYSLIEKHKL